MVPSRFGLLAASFVVTAFTSLPMAWTPVQELSPGVRQTLNVSPGSVVTVPFTAQQGEFVHLRVETAGRVREPRVVDGRDQPVAAQARIRNGRSVDLMLEVPATGAYSARMRLDGPAGAGIEYIPTLEVRRPPDAGDRSKLEATRLFAEAQVKAADGTAAGRRAALVLLQQSAQASEEVGDRLALGDTLNRMGQLHYGLSEFAKSIELHERAASVFESAGDLRGRGEALGNAGASYRLTGDHSTALARHQAALEIARLAGDRRAEAFALHNIGAVEYSLSNYAQAIAHYEQSLELKRAVGEIDSTAVTMSNLAVTLARLGDTERATEYRRQALELHRASGNQAGAAFDQMAVGIDLVERGRADEGFGELADALATFQRLGHVLGEAQVLHNTAALSEAVKDGARALQLYERALPLRRKVGDPATISTTLMRLGALRIRLGDRQQAAADLAEALALKQKAKDRYGEAYVAGHLAVLYDINGDTHQTKSFANRALELSRAVSDPIGEATALHQLGTILTREAPDQALAVLQQALDIRTRLRAPAAQAATRLAMARVHAATGDLDAARQTLEPAIGIVESLRAGLVNPDLRTTFFAGYHEHFELMVDLLMRQHSRTPDAGHDRAALEYSERGRARRLLDALVEARVDVRQGVDETLLAEERRLERAVASTETAIVGLLSGRSQKGVELAEDRLREQRRDLEAVRAKIRQQSPAYAALRFPAPISVATVQREHLDPQTAAIEFMLGPDRSYAWLVTADTIRSVELPASGELRDLAVRLRQALTVRQDAAAAGRDGFRSRVAASDRQAGALAAQIGCTLFGPLAIGHQFQRLVLIADGALEGLPYAALEIPLPGARGAGRLVDRFELVQLPSLAALAELRSGEPRPPRATASVAVLADPVFRNDDPRLRARAAAPQPAAAPDPPRGTDPSPADVSLDRLRFSRREAQAIEALAPGRVVTRLDFDANRASLASPPLRQADVLHFATHARVHPVHPELSGIVLSLVGSDGSSQDGLLRLADLYNLDVNADLVVLSACETAIGPDVPGEGVQALSRGFLYAGARRVVASLWQVDDRATSVFMQHFYRALLREKQTPPAALRTAMQHMSRDPRWSAPYFWAGFVVQGDW